MLILSLCILTVIEASKLTKGTGNEVSPVGVETGNMDSFDVSLFHDKDRISGQLLNTSNVDECKNFQLKANSSFADGSGNYTCVDIEIPKPVILIGKDALDIWCKPGIQYSEIISYKIKHHPLLGNKTDECEWIYHNTNKSIFAICTNVKIIVLWEPPLPLENATLHLKIDKINVTLYEAGNYSCWISAATEEKHIEAESSLKAVEVRKNPKPPVPREHHLSGGEIAGISIGCVVFVCILVVVAVIMYICRGQGKKDNYGIGNDDGSGQPLSGGVP